MSMTNRGRGRLPRRRLPRGSRTVRRRAVSLAACGALVATMTTGCWAEPSAMPAVRDFLIAWQVGNYPAAAKKTGTPEVAKKVPTPGAKKAATPNGTNGAKPVNGATGSNGTPVDDDGPTLAPKPGAKPVNPKKGTARRLSG